MYPYRVNQALAYPFQFACGHAQTDPSSQSLLRDLTEARLVSPLDQKHTALPVLLCADCRVARHQVLRLVLYKSHSGTSVPDDDTRMLECFQTLWELHQAAHVPEGFLLRWCLVLSWLVTRRQYEGAVLTIIRRHFGWNNMRNVTQCCASLTFRDEAHAENNFRDQVARPLDALLSAGLPLTAASRATPAFLDAASALSRAGLRLTNAASVAADEVSSAEQFGARASREYGDRLRPLVAEVRRYLEDVRRAVRELSAAIGTFEKLGVAITRGEAQAQVLSRLKELAGNSRFCQVKLGRAVLDLKKFQETS
ncbi:hypothetical protein F5Y15DRAFT_422330 [Xylariaceae sp. FL0016]|nr:hypothetical protein F5Y15DRAFT_422330 [Xylariaceae sp. FL0016]